VTQSNQNFSTVFQGLHTDDKLTARGAPYDINAGLDYETGDNLIAERVVKGGSCKPYKENFQRTVALTNSSGIKYNVFSSSSNSFVYTALQRAGLSPNYFYNSLNSQMRQSVKFYQVSYGLPGWGRSLALKE
jgi:hypothetical protein